MNKEKIYDKEIAPLMDKIIEVCKREEIPFFCDYQLTKTDKNNEESGLFCTTCVYDYVWVEKEKFREYVKIARPENFAAFTITKKEV